MNKNKVEIILLLLMVTTLGNGCSRKVESPLPYYGASLGEPIGEKIIKEVEISNFNKRVCRENFEDKIRKILIDHGEPVSYISQITIESNGQEKAVVEGTSGEKYYLSIIQSNEEECELLLDNSSFFKVKLSECNCGEVEKIIYEYGTVGMGFNNDHILKKDPWNNLFSILATLFLQSLLK